MTKLLLLYVDAAKAHGEATESGDNETANRCAARISELHKQIRAKGEDGANALRKLMAHDNDMVRHWAAFHCLSFAPREAEQTLAEIAAQKGSLVSFSAQVTLEEWRKGNLDRDGW